MPKPKCECTSYCGDDPRVATRQVIPCATKLAEREAHLAQMRTTELLAKAGHEGNIVAALEDLLATHERLCETRQDNDMLRWALRLLLTRPGESDAGPLAAGALGNSAPEVLADTALDSSVSAAIMVLAERRRQVSVEGWDATHDDVYVTLDLPRAAACYALSAGGGSESGNCFFEAIRSCWPWAAKWWKPSTPMRDLEKAGALILAEIERRIRQAASTGSGA